MSRQVSHAVGVVVGNHVDYVHRVFELLEAGDCAVLLHTAADAERLPHLSIRRVITPVGTDNTWSSLAFVPRLTDDPALISFTSGTEGQAKAVVVSHRALADTVTRLNDAMGVDGTIREYVGVPVHHSFGFGRCRAVATAGGRFYVPPAGFNPSELRRMLSAGEINAVSTVPSLWRIVLAQPEILADVGDRVRYIEIGSQYMSAEEKAQLAALFPRAAILQHYGLTEASRSTLLRVDQASAQQRASVGRAVGQTELRINEEGRIAVRGPHLAQGYASADGITPFVDDHGWFLTKDLGRIEADYLYYEGRADDVINCGGLKVQPELLEAAVRARLAIEGGFAIARRADALRGEAFLVALEPSVTASDSALRAAVVEELKAFGVQASAAVTIVHMDALPRTGVGKVKRAELSRWYAETQPAPSAEQTAVSELAPAQSSVAQAFCRHLRVAQVDAGQSFVELGGDSLTYVQLGIDLERILGPLPRNWEALAVGALAAARRSAAPSQSVLDTSVLVRALGIVGVVTNHAGLLPARFIEGGALLLLLTAGSNFARFQLPTLAKGELVRALSALLRNLVLPYVVVIALFQLAKRDFEPAVLFGFSNYLDPNLPAPFPVWFLQVLTQVIAAMALVFTLPQVRALARSAPLSLALGFHGVALALAAVVPLFWDTAPLWHAVPHCVLWYFTLGISVHFASTPRARLALSALILVSQLVTVEFHLSALVWVVLGGLLLLWRPAVSLPPVVARIAQQLGAATYYIYLTHLQVVRALERVLGTSLLASLAGFVLSIAFGVLVALAVERVSLRKLFARQRVGGVHVGGGAHR